MLDCNEKFIIACWILLYFKYFSKFLLFYVIILFN